MASNGSSVLSRNHLMPCKAWFIFGSASSVMMGESS